MATSRDLGEFAKRITVLASEFGDEVGRVMRKAALAADQVAVTLTPVDTGRARANWILSIGVPRNDAPVQIEKGKKLGEGPATDIALEQSRGEIARFRIGMGPIFIANNVEYIVPLDQGHSRQRPEGMSALALQAAANVFQRERLRLGQKQ